MISRADGIDDTLKHTKYSGRLANVIRIIQIYIWKPLNCSSTPLKTKNKNINYRHNFGVQTVRNYESHLALIIVSH